MLLLVCLFGSRCLTSDCIMMVHHHPTCWIIPFSKCLITGLVSPLTGVVPLPNGLKGLWLVDHPNYLLTGMILQVCCEMYHLNQPQATIPGSSFELKIWYFWRLIPNITTFLDQKIQDIQDFIFKQQNMLDKGSGYILKICINVSLATSCPCFLHLVLMIYITFLEKQYVIYIYVYTPGNSLWPFWDGENVTL